jgi:hypothetical protein
MAAAMWGQPPRQIKGHGNETSRAIIFAGILFMEALGKTFTTPYGRFSARTESPPARCRALSQMFDDGGADQCYSLKSGRALLD